MSNTVTRRGLAPARKHKRTRIVLNNNGYFASGMLVGGLIVGFLMWALLMTEPAAAATTTVTPTTGWTFQGIVLATILAVIVASAVTFMIIAGYLRSQQGGDDER